MQLGLVLFKLSVLSLKSCSVVSYRSVTSDFESEAPQYLIMCGSMMPSLLMLIRAVKSSCSAATMAISITYKNEPYPQSDLHLPQPGQRCCSRGAEARYLDSQFKHFYEFEMSV